MHKSFLKWAGGKGQLVDKIISLMPLNNKKRYLEPFVGSGIMALNVDFPEIIIADVNKPLIDLWKRIQIEGNTFISTCRGYFNSVYNNDEWYYKYRKYFNDGEHYPEKSALFLYLNKHGFNGLCRYNKAGEFNVPYGHKAVAPSFPEKELRHAMEVSKKMSIHCCSFWELFRLASPGDVFYNDPPYIPVSKTSNFTAYSQDGFTLDDQMQLVQASEVARAKGATVIISNNDVPDARELYKNADEIHFVQVQKKISCTAANRKKLQEIIAVYRPKKLVDIL